MGVYCLSGNDNCQQVPQQRTHGEGTQASKGDTSRRELAAGAGMRGAH